MDEFASRRLAVLRKALSGRGWLRGARDVDALEACVARNWLAPREGGCYTLTLVGADALHRGLRAQGAAH